MLATFIAFVAAAGLVAAQDATPQIYPPVGAPIHPLGHNNKCLDIAGNVIANGTEVRVYDCNGTGAQRWLINPGNTKIRVASNDTYCLDAGSDIVNGAKLKIWWCYDGLVQQQWWLTNDNRIAVTNQGQCMDLTDGDLGNPASKQTQIWQCSTGNPNQAWEVGPTILKKKRTNRYEK